ncbi:MAG: hypothetical protein M3Q39_16745 [Actinomycetota bacterium]|nr:hypothetical protein [Actinomycetota bacterium]
MTRPRAEHGSALVEVTWLTLLLLVPLVYFVLSVFDVQRAAFGTSAAARAAGRAYVLSPDQQTAHQRALEAASVALRDQGLDLSAADLRISCEPSASACLQPGSVVTVSLDVEVALPLMPDVFAGQPPSIRVGSEHRAPYGTFREAR